MFQRFHEKELSHSVPAWNYGDIDIFCCGDNATTGDYMQIIKDFEEKLKLNNYTISCKLTKRFNSKSTGCVDADRVSLRPHLSKCDIRLIDYTIEGIPVDISFINMSRTNNIDTILRSFDLSCCSVSFSCSFSNKNVCDINLTCCQWKKGDLNWEGDSIMGEVSSYDDIIKGNMHLMLTECQNKRVSKYQSRGLKNVIDKVKVMKKQINSESKSSTSGPCENSIVSVASVYNDCQNHGALIDVEHNNLAPSNIIDDNVETKTKDVETKSEPLKKSTEKLVFPTLPEIYARKRELAAQDLLASSDVEWVHFSMFAGIGTSSHALEQNLKDACHSNLTLPTKMATYFFEIEASNRDILEHHFPNNDLYKRFDDVMILENNRFITLLAILLHHGGGDGALSNVLITSGSPCQDLSKANPNRTGLNGEMSGLFCKLFNLILYTECFHFTTTNLNVFLNLYLFLFLFFIYHTCTLDRYCSIGCCCSSKTNAIFKHQIFSVRNTFTSYNYSYDN